MRLIWLEGAYHEASGRGAATDFDALADICWEGRRLASELGEQLFALGADADARAIAGLGANWDQRAEMNLNTATAVEALHREEPQS